MGAWDLQGSRAGLIDKPRGDARAHDDFQAIVCSIADEEERTLVDFCLSGDGNLVHLR